MILNGGKPLSTDWPKDAHYFDYMVEGLAHVAIEPQDKIMYAMLAPLGIAPGQPFTPDARVRGILERAADTGASMMTTLAFASRTGAAPLWPDRRWEDIKTVTSPDFVTPTRVELDERAQGWYQLVMNGRYGYGAKLKPGTGSWYALTYKDAGGRYLDGGASYRFTLQADPPTKQFWSLAIYDVRTRRMVDTDEQRAELSSFSPLKKNADGSLDLYLGPAAPAGMASNWIKTIPGTGFFAMFRLYAPLEPVLDGSWKLNDIERVTGP
jgi:hypothetical protein